uniref:Uncharacterized protein n=1 Tax=viral metagenome TaxID=1070528 RepID=A0A6C0EKN4_9ZZZZ
MEIINNFNFSYINGEDKRSPNAFDIALNTIFVLTGIRPAFMVQSIDYQDQRVFKRILTLIFKSEELIGVQIDQGVIILRSDRPDLLQLIQEYENTDSDSILGQILGYPCYAEFDPTIEQKFYSIGIKGNPYTDIMTNGCKTERNVRKMYRLFKRMQKVANKLNVELTFSN